MRLIAFFDLASFYADTLQFPGVPVVIHRDKLVLDANAFALTRNIQVGLPLATARVVLAGEGRFIEWEEEPYRSRHRTWMEMASLYSDAIEPLQQHNAWIDFSSHPHPEDLAERLANDLSQAGFHPRWALAGSRWVAQVAAVRGDPIGMAWRTTRRFVGSLPTSQLPVEEAIVRRLQLLGYPSIGDVAQIDITTLRGQFGSDAPTLARYAQGGGDGHVEAVFPIDSVADRVLFSSPPETLAEFEAALHEVCQRLTVHTQDQEKVGDRVELFLEYEDATVERRFRTFSKPFMSAHDLEVALKLLLSPLPELPLQSLRVRLPELKPAARVQLNLQGGRSRADRDHAISAALASVRTTFGDTSLMIAGDIVEPRWKQLRRAYSAINDWAWA